MGLSGMTRRRIVIEYKLLVCILTFISVCGLFFSFRAAALSSSSFKKEPSFELVVSYYNESLDWTLPYHRNVMIYNKGPFLSPSFDSFRFKRVIRTPNVGREAYVYLYHIIDNYDNLADLTLFFQADAYESHKSNVLASPLEYIKRYKETPWVPVISRWYHTRGNNVWGRIRRPGEPLEELHATVDEVAIDKTRSARGTLAEFWEDIFHNHHPEFIQVSYSSNLGVTREAIHRHSREWYEYILSSYLSDHSNPEEATYLEFLWHSIWF